MTNWKKVMFNMYVSTVFPFTWYYRWWHNIKHVLATQNENHHLKYNILYSFLQENDCGNGSQIQELESYHDSFISYTEKLVSSVNQK